MVSKPLRLIDVGETGHKVIFDYEWKRKSSGEGIPLSAVQDLPSSLKVDLNGDGAPGAY